MTTPKFTPVIDSDRPRPFRNSDTQQHAEIMAAEIRNIWAAHGYEVSTRVEPVSGRKKTYWQVRSDMINGMPQRKLGQTKAA